MQNPLVSILIPFKNVEDFFVECINSIIAQTYTNWELIAVNDHSTDNSASILSAYCKKDDRLKLMNNDGNGIINALQLAYTNSSGEYITRMDADDIMTPDKLMVLQQSLQKNGTGNLAIGQVHYFSQKGINDGYARYEKWLNRLTDNGSNFSEIYKECVIPSPCWMVHKSDFDACDAFNPNRYPEDYDLAFRFYKNKLRCLPCNQVLHHWRDYSTRTSRTSEHYAQNYFLDIKLHYFLALDYDSEKCIVVWGAGNKGKEIAKKLIERNYNFIWVCDNPKKIGKEIYGQKLQHFSVLESVKNPQCIITVANESEQESIKKELKVLLLTPSKDYFFFC